MSSQIMHTITEQESPKAIGGSVFTLVYAWDNRPADNPPPEDKERI